ALAKTDVDRVTHGPALTAGRLDLSLWRWEHTGDFRHLNIGWLAEPELLGYILDDRIDSLTIEDVFFFADNVAREQVVIPIEDGLLGIDRLLLFRGHI